VLAIITVMVSIAGMYMVRSYVSKNYLVELIEESINSRVEIGEIDFTLFGHTGIRIEHLKIAERDTFVKERVPHDDRPTLQHSDIQIGSLGLKVSIADVLEKKIDVSQILMDKANIHLIIQKDGSMNLSHLFKSPPSDQPKQKKAPGGTKSTEKKKVAKKTSPEKQSFNAKDQSEFVTLLREAEIRDSEISLVIEKSGLQVNISDLNMITKDIRIDPNSLETINQATIGMSGQLTMLSKEGHIFGDLQFDGPVSVQLFNATTGETEPNATVNFQFHKNSYLNPTIPIIKKAWDKLDVLQKVGLNVGDIPEKLTFGGERRLAASYHMGLAELKSDISLTVKHWEIAVLQGGWANIPQSVHGVQAELIAPKDHSLKVNQFMTKTLGKIPGDIGKKTAADFHNNWFNSNQQLALTVSAQGDLSKPKVKLVNELPEIKDLLKAAGKDRLQSELNKLLESGDGSKLQGEAENLLKGLFKR